jgi:hypothetical protein
MYVTYVADAVLDVVVALIGSMACTYGTPALGVLNQAVCGKGYAPKRRRRRWISYSWTMAVA